MIGKLLRGHYQVVSFLGGGGGGETYIAVDTDRPGQPQCVVKRLKPATNDPNFMPIAKRLFKREAETLEQLGRHDQIPRLLAYFEEDDEFYLVQDFIEGQPLNVELPPGHCWSEMKVIRLLDDVLRILDFVHTQGAIHRDIKPANLIRRQKDGRIVLIDFGAVKQVRQNPQAETQLHVNPLTISIGTQGYMSVEQMRGKPRASSDIYSLGMIGIQALTGIDPIHLEESRDGDVVWQRPQHASEELALVLTRMVRYHFCDRYETASEALQALKSLIDQKLLEQTGIGNKEIDNQAELSNLTSESQESQPIPKVSEPRGTRVVSDTDSEHAFSVNFIENRQGVKANSEAQSSNFENLSKNSQNQRKKLALTLGIGSMAVAMIATSAWALRTFLRQPNYTQLEQYLQQQNWEAADKETYEVMLEIAGPKSSQSGEFNLDEWSDFSCEEFQKIDSLWHEASAGQLGFAAQLKIFREIAEQLTGENWETVSKDKEMIKKVTSLYFEKIGWKPFGQKLKVRWERNGEAMRFEYIQNGKPNFENPPAGHLPAILPWGDKQDYRIEKSSSCKL